MLPLFPDLEAISACRDRNALALLLVKAVVHLFGEQADVALFCRDRDELGRVISRGKTVDEASAGPWQEMLAVNVMPVTVATRECDGRTYGVVPLQASEIGGTKKFLAFAVASAKASESLEDLLCLVRVYGNHLRLLDYSELDSLTRLLNRKTFDETFDRLLMVRELTDSDDLPLERRAHDEGAPWLGVIDIDHFKRINDGFGHLFGDEVLLRIADMMRKTFRSEDRLFRFGGEEFVVILNAEDEELAARGFDRFRSAVENYEFPQIGKVTCSVGITGVAASDVPTDVVGRADEALYFAKEHGRNQVSCYEMLLAQGAIATAMNGAAADFDIDSLFN